MDKATEPTPGRKCQGCDSIITPGARERNKKRWCSQACRVRTYYRANPKPPRIQNVCKISIVYCQDCDQPVVAQPGRPPKRCKPCTRAHQIQRDYAAKLLFLQRNGYYPGSTLDTCPVCGTEFYRRRGATTCSRSCGATLSNRTLYTETRRQAEAQKAKASYLRLQRKAQRLADASANPPTSPYIWVSGPCAECGQPFTGRQAVGTTLTRHCSRICRTREANRARRAAKRGSDASLVSRDAIIKRDRGICYLCGKKVNLIAKVPHPLAPTLDHVIPLAVGGTHEPSNLKLACFTCNCHKRDNPASEALASLGYLPLVV